MSDLIRREDAIKALRCEYPTMPIFKGLREEWAIKTEGFRKAEEVIMNLPSADRPQGFWTKTDVATYRCSECGKKQIADDVNELNYCCCCGSQNKVHYKVQMLKGADDE